MQWIKAQDHLAKNDTKMQKLIHQFGDCTLKPAQDYFTFLAESIVSQQLSVKAADTIWARVKNLVDGQSTPQKFIDLDADKMREAGVSRSKSQYIKNIAQCWLDNILDDEKVLALNDDTLVKLLLEIKGVGPWTVDMFFIFALNRPNVLPLGDLGIRNAICALYGLDKTAKMDDFRKVAEGWHPWCSVASWYLWKSLNNVPTTQ